MIAGRTRDPATATGDNLSPETLLGPPCREDDQCLSAARYEPGRDDRAQQHLPHRLILLGNERYTR